MQQRGQHQDRRIDGSHGDVPVERAELVHLEQFGRQAATDVQHRQAGTLGAGLDQRRRADPHDRLRHARLAQRLDRHQRILAAANCHQRMLAQADGRRRPGPVSGDGETDLAAQDHAVAIGEFAEAVFVELGHQRRSVGVDRIAVDLDARRRGRLEVADAGNQVQQPKRLLHGLATRAIELVGRSRKADCFGELGTLVEGIDQARDATGLVEVAAKEAEGLDGRAVELEISHR